MFRSRIGWMILTLLASLVITPGTMAQSKGSAAPRPDRPLRISRGLLHEGAFLADLTGRLLTFDQHGSAFVFDPNAQGRATPPMSLLPCAMLMRMEQIRDARDGEARFRISGQVFLKDGRNYLLPTHYTVLSSEAGADEALPETLEHDPADDSNPSVEDLIAAIETLTPLARNDDGLLALPTSDLIADGVFFRPRRGRIVHSPTGAIAFAVNNDLDQNSTVPVSLTIMPSQGLALIERLLDAHGGESEFIVSGRIYLYRNQNFLLPSMVQLQLDTSSGLSSAR